MNLKLDKGGVVFKISEEEMNALHNGLEKQESIFIDSQEIKIIINRSTEKKETAFNLLNNHTGIEFRLILSHEDITSLKQMGRNREGISKQINGINVRIQVDIRQDSRRKNR